MRHLNKIIVPLILLAVVKLQAMKATKETSGHTLLPVAAKLFFAIQRGDFEEVQETLMADRDCVNALDNLGNTPLIMATIKENPFIVHILLTNNATIDLKTPYGQTALDLAQKLYAFKITLEQASRKSYERLSSKEKKTDQDWKEMVKQLEDLNQLVSSLNNLDAIIQQLNNTPKDSK